MILRTSKRAINWNNVNEVIDLDETDYMDILFVDGRMDRIELSECKELREALRELEEVLNNRPQWRKKKNS